MTALVWILLLREPVSFAEHCDRMKVFYSRNTWR